MIQKMLEGITLRFDDVCANADMHSLNEMSLFAHSLGATIIYCISPLVQDMSHLGQSKDAQRIYPKIWNAMSDYRQFYQADIASIPKIPSYVTTASHGLIHVDHRLLKKSAQEMSILVSCSLAKSEIFVPPFNKWNKDTQNICNENGIKLVKFEDGWKCMEYNKFDPAQKLWYSHHREFTVDSFKKWFETK
jgi:hypothetical protein